MTTNIEIEVTLTQFQADPRPYKPGNQLYECELAVQTQIPCKPEFLCNWEELLKAPLEAEKPPIPILTPEGVRFIIDAFQEPFIEKEIDEDDVDWEDEEEEAFDDVAEGW